MTLGAVFVALDLLLQRQECLQASAGMGSRLDVQCRLLRGVDIALIQQAGHEHAYAP